MGLVFAYYQLGASHALRFVADYNYFLYVLAFHVTFSFKPKQARRPSFPVPSTADSAA